MSKTAAQLVNFRDLPEEEIRQQLAQTRDELFRLQLGQYTNQVTSTAAIVGKRRDIARILTILRSRELGTETQVLVVTHLAQVAAPATTQLLVSKDVSRHVTVTSVAQVDGEARVAEIARMLAGDDSTAAREHARQLLSR